jgi:isocitrate dehydrogenase
MKHTYNGLLIPATGAPIVYSEGRMQVPDNPIIPFIEGDGTGRDIWKAAQRVFDAAVAKAYGGTRHLAWFEVFAGEKAKSRFGNWLPDETVEAFRDLHVGIKGPLTTPVGGGIRSLNVALRQTLDLYACIRPVKYYQGIPSPVQHPENMDIVIFRENTEDVYAGIEFREGTPDAQNLIEYINRELLAGTKKRIRPDSGIGIKPISITATKRLVRKAIEFALAHQRPSVTLVHKGNIQKFTEGAFREWGYQVATEEFRDQVVTERESWIFSNIDQNPVISIEENAFKIEPGMKFAPPEFRTKVYEEVESVVHKLSATHGKGLWKNKLLINDRIADSIFQQLILRPEDYSVLATPNLNGDYISDAAAAQVGGLGIAPGANVGAEHAIFEATHGTAPRYADQDVINPGSVILSGVMMLEHLGWTEAAALIENALQQTLLAKTVTYDFARQLEGATKVGTSEFATKMIEKMM